VLGILSRHGARSLIKGKSMVSEEMGLNHALEREGVEALESTSASSSFSSPARIVAHHRPAVHKSRHEVSASSAACSPICHARGHRGTVRHGARDPAAASSSPAARSVAANFSWRDGTIVLVENEGNGRLCTTAPDVHVR